MPEFIYSLTVPNENTWEWSAAVAPKFQEVYIANLIIIYKDPTG